MSSSHYMHIAHIGGEGGALVQIVASTLEENNLRHAK